MISWFLFMIIAGIFYAWVASGGIIRLIERWVDYEIGKIK